MAAKKIEPNEIPALNRVTAEINKKYGANTIGTMNSMEHLNIERLSTGIASLDKAVGGGMPMGRMVELYGVPSSGKSLISMATIIQAQKKNLECAYIDCENSFDPVFAEKLGVDVKKLYVSQVSEGEDVIDIIAKLLEAQPGVIVIDSVAAMITHAEVNEPMEQQFMAVKARLLSRGLAKLNALNKKTLLIFINQLRSTMVMYGQPTTTTGGRALGHYASLRVEVKQGDKLTIDGKKTSEVIGQVANFIVKKNKTAAPFQQGSFNFLYKDGTIE